MDSEIRFRELFNNIPNGAAIYQAIDNGNNFIFLDFNKAAERLDQISREELLHQPVTAVFPGVKDFGLLSVMQRVWDTGIPAHHPLSFYKDERISAWRDNYVYKLPSGEIVALYEDLSERKQIEDTLQKSEARFRLLADNAPDIIFRLTFPEGTYEYVSPAVRNITGYTPEDFYQSPKLIEQIIHPDWKDYFYETWQNALKGEIPPHFEFQMITKSGEVKWINQRNILIKDNSNQPLALEGIATDITDRKLAEQEKEVLLREVYHRTKNNMQVICSLLRLQSMYTQDEQLTRIVKETEGRIFSMALIHEKLYQSEDLSKIDLGKYLKDLACSVMINFRVGHENVSLHTDTASVIVSIDTAVPCGLAVNEILSNALKYAFPKEIDGIIDVSLKLADNNEIHLTISDNGVGMPHDFDLDKASSLGLKLVSTLVTNQLKGNIDIIADKGTKYHIRFKDIINSNNK